MPSSNRPHVVIYAGSFDPITRGHLDVLQRARQLFDHIVVGIGQNPEKASLFTPAERLEMTRALVKELVEQSPTGAAVDVHGYKGLTVDFARTHNAVAIIRGIRNITDLAAETQLAITNRQVADIETVFIVTDERFAYTSSSLIRQVAALGGSLDRLSALVPRLVIDRMQKKMNEPGNPLKKLAQDAHIE